MSQNRQDQQFERIALPVHYWHDHDKVVRVLGRSDQPPSRRELDAILQKAVALEPLSLEQAAILVRAEHSRDFAREIFSAADHVRRLVFDNEVKFYVPVYITNVCVNNCTYCGFRQDNKELDRIILNPAAFSKEVEHLLGLGHRHIEVVLGYHPRITNGTKLAEYIRPVRDRLAAHGDGTIILMSEPMQRDDYVEARKAGVTEVYSWQETYHPETYQSLHPTGTHKADQAWRYQLFDRALAAGIPRIGMGVLSGLYKWEYDELALMQHALWMRGNYGQDPYAFGVPRFKPGEGIPIKFADYAVDDQHYKLSIAIRRLMFPRTHTYMNSREDMSLLIDLLRCGGTEINAEASTVPGGYTRNTNVAAQFFHYSFDSAEVFQKLREEGFAPTFDEVTPRK